MLLSISAYLRKRALGRRGHGLAADLQGGTYAVPTTSSSSSALSTVLLALRLTSLIFAKKNAGYSGEAQQRSRSKHVCAHRGLLGDLGPIFFLRGLGNVRIFGGRVLKREADESLGRNVPSAQELEKRHERSDTYRHVRARELALSQAPFARLFGVSKG